MDTVQTGLTSLTGLTSSASPPARLRDPAKRVSPRAVRYWLVRALTGWVLVTAAQVAGLLLFAPHRWQVVALITTGVVAALHLAVMPRWRYAVHRWELTQRAVYTQVGWFTRERRIAPLERIQTVDTTSGPIGRLFGLANITVTTASAAGPLHIDSLAADDAATLADALTTAAQLAGGDAT